MRLYLIRHPQPEIAEGVCYGRTDVPLRQPWSADSVLDVLPAGTPIQSSPLQRCADFAAAISSRVSFNPLLAELDFGAWEMQAWDNLPRAQLDAWAADPLNYAEHGGESVQQMQGRVQQALAGVGKKDCAWITHAGVIKLVFAELLGLPQDEWLKLHFAYASINVIEIDKGKARLHWQHQLKLI